MKLIILLKNSISRDELEEEIRSLEIEGIEEIKLNGFTFHFCLDFSQILKIKNQSGLSVLMPQVAYSQLLISPNNVQVCK